MISEKLSSDGLNLETKVQNINANLKFDGVIGHKRGCQYNDLPQFVRDIVDFKNDHDVVITHIADTRMEMRLKDVFKRIEEVAEKNLADL